MHLYTYSYWIYIVYNRVYCREQSQCPQKQSQSSPVATATDSAALVLDWSATAGTAIQPQTDSAALVLDWSATDRLCHSRIGLISHRQTLPLSYWTDQPQTDSAALVLDWSATDRLCRSRIGLISHRQTLPLSYWTDQPQQALQFHHRLTRAQILHCLPRQKDAREYVFLCF